MSNFYTYCAVVGNKILYRGIEDDQRISRSIYYSPSLFVPSNKKSKYKTLDGLYVERIQHSDISSAREFIRNYEDITGFTIYGNTNFQYCYISDTFENIIDYDFKKLVIANIDIETACEVQYALPENPSEAIIALSVKVNNNYYVFGCKNFENTNHNIKYFKCDDEVDLLNSFLNVWEQIKPDIITGWNIAFFDIPYLVNRIIKILGDKEAKRLSPWKYFSNRKVHFKGRTHDIVELLGISTLDYMELYKKFQPQQEKDSLNYISYVELGEKKLDYSEYGSLYELYKKNFQKFIEYNIKDVDLVSKLDEKLNLIGMVVATAYDAKVNFVDVLSQVRMWDTIVFNYFKQRKLVLPPKKENIKEVYPGGYVKEPLPGLYKNIVSFDLDSLYPHLIAQNNISPECLVASEYKNGITTLYDNVHIECKNLLNQKIQLDYLKNKNLALACNGHHFKKEKIGFFPEILMKMYDDRVEYKKKAKLAKIKLDEVNKELHKRGIH